MGGGQEEEEGQNSPVIGCAAIGTTLLTVLYCSNAPSISMLFTFLNSYLIQFIVLFGEFSPSSELSVLQLISIGM